MVCSQIGSPYELSFRSEILISQILWLLLRSCDRGYYTIRLTDGSLVS